MVETGRRQSGQSMAATSHSSTMLLRRAVVAAHVHGAEARLRLRGQAVAVRVLQLAVKRRHALWDRQADAPTVMPSTSQERSAQSATFHPPSTTWLRFGRAGMQSSPGTKSTRRACPFLVCSTAWLNQSRRQGTVSAPLPGLDRRQWDHCVLQVQ